MTTNRPSIPPHYSRLDGVDRRAKMSLPFMSFSGDGDDDIEARGVATPAPSSSSSSSQRPYGINDAWDTPIRNNSYNSIPPQQKRAGSLQGPKRVVPRQVFHIIATLLIVSMVMLLVELRTPGFSVHMGKNLSTLWGRNRIISNTIAPSATTNMRGGHFPPNFELLDSIIAEPTSEPTQLIGSYKWAAGAPTSEPTEYRTSQNFGNVIVAPTSEPTEYIRDDEDPINLPPPHALAAGNTPTLEPTMFNANSAEVNFHTFFLFILSLCFSHFPALFLSTLAHDVQCKQPRAHDVQCKYNRAYPILWPGRGGRRC